jgi:hypothetical protein
LRGRSHRELLGSAYAAQQVSINAKSGEAKECTHGCGHWRVDANGKDWPVTIEYLTRPANGTVRTKLFPYPKKLRNGEVKTVRVSQVIYQSRKGFVGQDSFTYRRTTADPTDPDNGREYAVAVTVR